MMKWTPFYLSFPCTFISPSPTHAIERQGYTITCTTVPHGFQSYAFAIQENPRPGKFHPNKARDLGIPEGRLFKALQHGKAIIHKGRKIQASEVCDQPRPGIKLVYSGDTPFEPRLIELAQEATILIHEATYLDEKDRKAKYHSTLTEAMRVADQAHCKFLALTHFSPRYGDLKGYPEKTPHGIPLVYAKDLLEIIVGKEGTVSIKN